MSIEHNELKEAAERVANGVHDPEAFKRARARMDKNREEFRKKYGTVDLAVPEIRAHRDE